MFLLAPLLFACEHRFTPEKMMKCGGKGIRTPDFQLAKLALYQLSYAPEKNTERVRVLATNVGVAEFRLPIFDCKEEKTNAECQS